MAEHDKARAEGSEEDQKRRRFLRTAMWASAGLVLAETALAGLALFWPRKVEGFGSKIRAGSLSDFPIGTVTRFRDGKFYLARLPEGIIALYWKCPHLGCTVPWSEADGLFMCPCHGSIYDITGQNVAGPAPRPMDYMAVEIDGDTVIVDTGDIRERSEHRPEHVTRI